jgi:hypothetical protein
MTTPTTDAPALDAGRPLVAAEVDLVVREGGRSVPARVVAALDGDPHADLVVSPEPLPGARPFGVTGHPEPPARGEEVDLYWVGPGEVRVVPVSVVAVDPGAGEAPRWRVRLAGPAARGQRRDAVRAPLAWPVRLGVGTTEWSGETVDVSETGVRCQLRATSDDDAAPAAGDPGALALCVSGRDLLTEVEVTRVSVPDPGCWVVSLRFVALPERSADLLRREVFTGLRELRARGLL